MQDLVDVRPQRRHLSRAASWQRGALLSLARADALALVLTLAVALVQGLLYLTLVPPWQHYDEPTHFEYTWLIANHTPLPEVGDEVQTMRRELAGQMYAANFYDGLPQPMLLSDASEIWLGITELRHPPAYYTLVSLPLRAAGWLDLNSQLYLARSVSLLLFLLTAAAACGLARELTRSGSVVRWAAPLVLVLIPPFADLMTAVNNDVGVILLFTLFLWAAVRMIRRGLTLKRALTVVALAVLAALTKNTGAVAVALAPMALFAAFWAHRQWRARWLGGGVALGIAAACVTTLGWGDAAFWYRWSFGGTQPEDSRVQLAGAPVGSHALQLTEVPGHGGHGLLAPILPRDTAELAGKQVTVGAWIWASSPAQASGPGPLYSLSDTTTFTVMQQHHDVSTTPRFVIQHFTVPADVSVLHVLAQIVPDPTRTEPVTMYVDGVVLAEGSFSGTPTCATTACERGTWDNQPFVNHVRNGSAEASWPHIRSWLEAPLYNYIHRSPSQTVAALFDTERIGGFTLFTTLPVMLKSTFGTFGWSQVRLGGAFWVPLAGGILGLALLGMVWWAVRHWRTTDKRLHVALLFLAGTMALVWGNVVARPLPLLDAWVVYPIARYGFPSLAATALLLTAGWLAYWPRRWRWAGASVLIAGLVLLNVAALVTIRQFFG